MTKKQIIACFIFIILMVGCQPAHLNGDSMPQSMPLSPGVQTKSIEALARTPTQVISHPSTPNKLNESKTENLEKGNRMPIFLEVTQTTIMADTLAQGPTIGVGPVLYAYNPGSNILMLHSTVTLGAETTLLVGVKTVFQSTDQVYERKAIIQFPPDQPDFIQILTVDMDTGAVHLVYDGETLLLSPGESRTFKQAKGSTTLLTIVSNFGYLGDIQEIFSDGSWR